MSAADMLSFVLKAYADSQNSRMGSAPPTEKQTEPSGPSTHVPPVTPPHPTPFFSGVPVPSPPAHHYASNPTNHGSSLPVPSSSHQQPSAYQHPGHQTPGSQHISTPSTYAAASPFPVASAAAAHACGVLNESAQCLSYDGLEAVAGVSRALFELVSNGAVKREHFQGDDYAAVVKAGPVLPSLLLAKAGDIHPPVNTRNPIEINDWMHEAAERIKQARDMANCYADLLQVSVMHHWRLWMDHNPPVSWSHSSKARVEELVDRFHKTSDGNEKREIQRTLSSVTGKTLKAIEGRAELPCTPENSVCSKTEQEARHTTHKRDKRVKVRLQTAARKIRDETAKRRTLFKLYFG